MTDGQLSNARLAWAAKGDTFTSTTNTIIVSRVNRDGSYSEVGRMQYDQSLSGGLAAVGLAAVFEATGASGPGKYMIEVDDGQTLIGTRTFTFV